MTSYHKSSINLWMSLYSMFVVGCSGPRQYKIDFAKFCVFSEFITTFLLLKYKHSSKKMLAGSFKLFICRNTSSSAHCKVFWWRCIAPPEMIVSIPKTLVWMYQNSLCHPKETNVGWKFTCCWISLVERKWRPLKPFSLFGGSNNTWDGSCSLASWVALASLAACYVLETSCRIRDDALRIQWHGGWDGRQRLGSHDHGRAPLHVFQIHAQPDRGDSSHAGLGGSCLSSWPQWGAPRGWSGGERRPEEGGGGGELPWWKPSSVLNAWVMEAAFIPRGRRLWSWQKL